MNNSDFKVMFVFINDRMRTNIPLNISYLSAALKKEGFSTLLFDTSFYKEHDRLFEEKKKEEAGIFKSVDYSTIGVHLKETSLVEDLLAAIQEEIPGLIVFSVFSQARGLNFRLAEVVKKRFPAIPNLLGGIHINIDPLETLSLPYIDYICLGEGEEALVEAAVKLANGEGVEEVRNIGWKKDNFIKINPCRAPQDLDKLPFPDWDIFEQYHQFGPYRGKLLRMALVEFSRTCPYQCTYCGNQIFKQRYQESGYSITYRHKSPEHWIAELKHMKDKYKVEFINVVDGTFVAQKEEILKDITSLYRKEIGLPFFCDATINCVTKEKVRLLKEMGCLCINMGIESGNEEYRRKYLHRYHSNSKITESFLMAKDAGLETRSYNIIGLPFQTVEDIMETVDLNRECKVDSVSLSIFVPYEGTMLRELCIKENLLDSDKEIVGDGTYPIIKNPNLSDEVLMELYNTFPLYVKAPKEFYPVIKLAGSDSKLRKELLSIFC